MLKILEFQRVGGYTKSRNNFRIAISLNSSQAKINYLECSGCKSQINIFFFLNFTQHKNQLTRKYISTLHVKSIASIESESRSCRSFNCWLWCGFFGWWRCILLIRCCYTWCSGTTKTILFRIDRICGYKN